MHPPKLSKEVFDSEFDRVRSLVEPHFANWFVGYEVPRGWIYLVERLHKELVSVSLGYRVRQVKEKFGTLRFYVEFEGVDEFVQLEIDSIISRFEVESAGTCQECGSSSGSGASLSGVLVTLCGDCFDFFTNRL